jgi:putative SOS response-associated peptidase YedK
MPPAAARFALFPPLRPILPLASFASDRIFRLTVPANEIVGAIHDRMPAIIPVEHHARWSGTGPDPRDLLRPFPAEGMRIFRPPR